MGKRIVINGDFTQNAIESKPQKLQMQHGYVDVQNNNVVLYNEGTSLYAKRLRTDVLSGKYTIVLNEGYVVRNVVEFSPSIANITPTQSGSTAGAWLYNTNYANSLVVGGVDTTFTYTGNNLTLVVVCKTDTTAEIEASEDVGTIQYL